MSNSSSLLERYPSSFVHLHLHTQYSLLDGAIRMDDLFKRVKEFDMPAIAQTDHGNMFGTIDFYVRAKENNIKPILGAEVYVTAGSRFDKMIPKKTDTIGSQDEMESRHHIHHLVLLCKNNVGLRNLYQLISKAYIEGFYYKPRIDLKLLEELSEGLIATTACLKGEVGYNFFIGQDERAYKAIFKLHDIFGEDLYLEIQENGMPEQKIVNEKVIAFSKEHNIPLVAANDCHYLKREDAAAQEVLLCVQTGKTLADDRRMKLSTNEFYLKSAEEMREAFSDIPEACDNTLRIAEKCNVQLNWTDEKGNQVYHLPDFQIDTKETPEEYFARIARQGLEKRFEGPHFKKIITKENWQRDIRPKYIARLEEEIKMIIHMGFAGYFLIVADFIGWSKGKGIPVGPGRGSGAGSIVAYALEITNIDPITYNLLFERFINPERITMPDFDIDFCQTRRGEVIEYVTKKYGKERVAQIVTFGQLKAKAALKDVARAFSLPYSEADLLTKLVPDELGIKLERAIELEPKLQELIKTDPKIRQIVNISKRLEGLLRHASVHAAGVIITNEPLINYCPLMRGREGEQVVQFDKDFSEMIGLVKFDFLGLKTLTVIDNAVDFVIRDVDPNFDIESIDLDDKNIYDFISNGNTIGVFQLESSGMIDLCKRICPNNLEEITAINALYRPGPLESGMLDDFIEVKHGRKEMILLFKELEPILRETYGVVVYQEQVMNIAREVAGYTLGQADMLRRAMGKKKVKEMERHREIFLQGAQERGFDLEKAADLYELMANFGAYGFNKSHAVAYAMIAYQTAFLKYYYPAQFFAALLSSEINNTDKITSYINDAKKYGIEVLPPDINESLWLFNVVDKNIRFGMGAVKNVGEVAVEEFIQQRKQKGPFKGLIDFCQRVNLKAANKRVIESLIKVGAFDKYESMNRRTLLEHMEIIMSYGQKKQEEKLLGQRNLFDMGEGPYIDEDPRKLLDIRDLPDFEDSEKLQYEDELMGIYVSGHPLEHFSDIIKQMASMEIAKVHELNGQDKREMVLAGIITNRKEIITKKGDKMCFATLEDLSGKIECIIFPKTYLEFENMLNSDDPLIINGHVNLVEDPRKIFPNKIEKLKKQAEDKVSGVRILIDLTSVSSEKLERCKQMLLGYRGSVPTHIIFVGKEGRARMPLGEEYLVNPTPQMAAKINEIFNTNSVKFIIDGQVEDGV